LTLKKSQPISVTDRCKMQDAPRHYGTMMPDDSQELKVMSDE
jgi:hypothetical protein